MSDNQGTIGLDWFEGAIARPGQVLKDVVRAVQPELASKVSGVAFYTVLVCGAVQPQATPR